MEDKKSDIYVVTFYQPLYFPSDGGYGSVSRGNNTVRKIVEEMFINDDNIEKHAQWMLGQINEGIKRKKFILTAIQKITETKDIYKNEVTIFGEKRP